MKSHLKKASRIFNKKGSYILEAAIVLPVIMLSVITAILIIMFFYTQMTEQCRLHKALREEAGKVTDKTIYMSDVYTKTTDADIYVDKDILGGKVYGKKYLTMEHKGILEKKGIFVLESSFYAADGPSYIRYSSAVGRGENE